MPYIVFTTDEYELDRRELADDRPLVIGRAPECDVSIRDILLSRKHCRIERRANGNVRLVDLQSKNGTRVKGKDPALAYAIADGDVALIGRTTMTYRAGAYEPAPPGTRMKTIVRPNDPADALSGTVAGFEYIDPMRTNKSVENFPQPRPSPPPPASFEDEEVYTLLAQLASSSWDSKAPAATRSDRPNNGKDPSAKRDLPRPMVRQESPRATTCDLSLQAHEQMLAVTPPVQSKSTGSNKSTRQSMTAAQVALSIIIVAVALAVFSMSAWIFVQSM
jgi:predicted component of type VI protein secretion system